MHATHTRRIPNQRRLLARQNGQHLVVVNGVSARISIVATGPLFRRTLLCDAGRNIHLHATRSLATGVEAGRKRRATMSIPFANEVLRLTVPV